MLYSKSFFNAMLSKVRDSRVNKKIIKSDEILFDIQKLKSQKNCPHPREYQHLLSEKDYRNMLIHTSVKEVFALKSLVISPIKVYFESLQKYIQNHIEQIAFPCSLCEDLKIHPEFEDMFLLNSEEKIKAMIINIYLEMEDSDGINN